MKKINKVWLVVGIFIFLVFLIGIVLFRQNYYLIRERLCNYQGGPEVHYSVKGGCQFKDPNAGKSCLFDDECKYYCKYVDSSIGGGEFRGSTGQRGYCSDYPLSYSGRECHRIRAHDVSCMEITP